jgi:hypothetical protein
MCRYLIKGHNYCLPPFLFKNFNNSAFKTNLAFFPSVLYSHFILVFFLHVIAGYCNDPEQPTGSNESGERFVLDLAATLKATDVQSIADQCDKAAPPVFGPQVLHSLWSNKSTIRSDMWHTGRSFFVTAREDIFSGLVTDRNRVSKNIIRGELWHAIIRFLIT